MTTKDVLDMLAERGLTLHLVGGQPILRGDRAEVTNVVLAAVKRFKAPIMKMLRARQAAQDRTDEAERARAADPEAVPLEKIPFRWAEGGPHGWRFEFLGKSGTIVVAKFFDSRASIVAPFYALKWRFCSEDRWRHLDTFPPTVFDMEPIDGK